MVKKNKITKKAVKQTTYTLKIEGFVYCQAKNKDKILSEIVDSIIEKVESYHGLFGGFSKLEK